jgi:hypothetical protein
MRSNVRSMLSFVVRAPLCVMALESELRELAEDMEEFGCVRRMTHIARARPVMPWHWLGIIERISPPRPGFEDLEERIFDPPNEGLGIAFTEDADESLRCTARGRLEELYEEEGRE